MTMHHVTVLLPLKYADALEELVAAKLYSSRSDALRCAVRDLLADHGKWQVAP